MADGKKTVSEKIFELLKQKDMSQKEFSERTGISQSTISDWKRKKTNPAADKILKICEVLQVSPSELLEEDEIEANKKRSGDYVLFSKDERFLVESYRNLEQNQKERLMGYMRALRDMISNQEK
ncbi:MAG TPA: helix-turn-helix domain-containing protein [Candidatus Blautia merdipullorum]|nr:helix-turn-helix domain-containing protein [Candidatus Blautia merdipullorum]